jgi:ATP-dependent DNA helicase RecQ
MAESPESAVFAPRCVSIDLEVGKKDGRIHQFAAVRGDTGGALVFNGGDLARALAQLDDFAEGATFLLGHNFTSFDRPHLATAKPALRLLELPDVDTLRLNPLAFPRNPYHYLVKHYQDGQLTRGRVNDPELDARLTLTLLGDQREALRTCARTNPALMQSWHWLVSQDEVRGGVNAFFATIRHQVRPSAAQASSAIGALLDGNACRGQIDQIIADPARQGWPLAYALAWLSVAGGNSVMPPWVRHQFPQAASLVRALRETPCTNADCTWCRERHDATKELARWFGFTAYRAEPATEDGQPLQQAIVEAAMSGESVLGILPTGTGKSVCYQVPALSRYDKTGALTVVISPLVALMADQVAGLQARGITACAAVNGMLSLPERTDVLDRVRLGDIAVLIISPEQLRNRSVRRVLAQREIGTWVLDEAHCLSKWGHDFRPDYRYVARFIREWAGSEAIPPVLCLTATAKLDVIADIGGYFRDGLDVELAVINGGANRSNLGFVVVPTTPKTKLAHIHQVLMADLPPDSPGGAIVYCSSRSRAEETAEFLRACGLSAEHFHGGMPPERKKDVLRRFVASELRVVAATNAFGMGIDKPDVRLVIHADLPGSLENYLQEAGRAGRDQQPARCVLLYVPEDAELQFGLSARSRLTRQEIAAILKSLRRLDRRKHLGGVVVATAGEILAEDDESEFQRDSATDDTRVRTAVAWLEEAHLLQRKENVVQVFPSSLRVGSVDEARQRLHRVDMLEAYRASLMAIVTALIAADPDDGITTDELMGVSGLSAEKVRGALYDLERLGIASNDLALTAFVHAGVERSSQKRLQEAASLEAALIAALREEAPELDRGESSVIRLRAACQRLKDAGHTRALPETLVHLLTSLAADGRDEEGGLGSLRMRSVDAETKQITLQRPWTALEKTAARRRAAAEILLHHFLAGLPDGSRGTDLLAETTLGKLRAALADDLVLASETKDLTKLMERALLWLHEQDVVRLNKGLAVFRQAMTIHLSDERRGFANADFSPLKLHYVQQVLQIHIMVEFVRRGLETMAEALGLVMDYFRLTRAEFIKRWLPGRDRELSLQTTPESWRQIVEDLRNPIQQRIVADDRERTNVLVLAGPGSGKTRVLVHRIAYLLRVRRENPRGILALAYNRHAAVEIRRRLADLIGDDAKGVTVMTCHALAMRLAGVSFAAQAQAAGDATRDPFRDALLQAIALLKGADLPSDEADEQRSRLLAGFRWILVDEYQDVGPEQYELIAALAGRTLDDEDGRLNLFAVGDDDQNIYAFAGASVEFIRRFEADYKAKPSYLTDNYRSTAHIIAAANAMIAPGVARMKADHPIAIDRARTKAAPGGAWQARDSVTQGRVQILPGGSGANTQALAIMMELQRLQGLSTDWNWSSAAVIAREWKYLDPVRSYCEQNGSPVQMGDEGAPHFWRLRETQALVAWLRERGEPLLKPDSVVQWLDSQPPGPWIELLQEAADAYALETGNAELPFSLFVEWLAEWGREVRRRQRGLLLLTAHRAKGLEFDHVAVLDGGWNGRSEGEDADAARRLHYVAMTRARHTLTLARMARGNTLLDGLPDLPCLLRRATSHLPQPAPELGRLHRRLTLRVVDIGFAGRYDSEHAVHTTIARLAAGDALSTREGQSSTELLSADGRVVGRLARQYRAPAGMVCVAASVAAIVAREIDDGDSEFRDRYRTDRWEVVVPDLVYAPMAANHLQTDTR